MSRLFVIADALDFNIERWSSQTPSQHQAPAALSPGDIRRINALALALTHHTIVDIVSSPSQRSLFVASAIAAHHPIPLARDSRLSPKPPGADALWAEAMMDIQRRSLSAVVQILQDNSSGGDIILVAHPANAALIIKHFSNVIQDDNSALPSDYVAAVLNFGANAPLTLAPQSEYAYPDSSSPLSLQ